MNCEGSPLLIQTFRRETSLASRTRDADCFMDADQGYGRVNGARPIPGHPTCDPARGMPENEGQGCLSSQTLRPPMIRIGNVLDRVDPDFFPTPSPSRI
jgi:hypothetical protein